ncbi:uncharacterized protein LOC131221257 isoform X2 [Magnolia sinica]|uniref:uncharacterized protein LOC131221257 isoform X2 n=1 Tax=Magnolia sinica TaxID=86752 RepID=UPI00265A03F6|nr:uncharacterized protein LOC131221257 isoform X2 [Magnolia sinica]
MMEKGKSTAKLTSSLEKLQLNSFPKPLLTASYGSPLEKVKRRSLVSLCLGVLGRHFEDIIADLSEIAASFPPDIKMAMMAIARRRKLLNDDILMILAESSWDILDVSGSDVSDLGLTRVAEMCKNLRAVDIRGCVKSDFTVRACLSIFKPKLNDVEEESWEELDSKDIANGAQSLQWFVWPTIDEHSKEILASECPRIIVNPKPSPLGFRGAHVPHEALPELALDDPIVKDIDPKTWAFHGVAPRVVASSVAPDSSELPMAERFRLAFMERDARLAPKRAKNARQHQRRAEREWVMKNTDAKSIALASQASKFLHNRS